MAERGLNVSQVSHSAELDQSLVSRLTATTPASRREPRIEHIFALARALGVAPGELVQGTDAASTLADWVPRSELDLEIAARSKARREVSTLKTENAALHQQVSSLEALVRQGHDRLAEANARADTVEIAYRAAETARRVAVAERDQWHRTAQEVHSNLRQLHSRKAQLERNYRGAQNSAAIGWLAALFAGAKLLTDEPAPRARKRRRRSVGG